MPREFLMRLCSEPFEMIQSGQKTIELRLYDQKRREISIGDLIRFRRNGEADAELLARVEALYRFDSFESLYKTLPLKECGYTDSNISNASPADMYRYYTPEEEKKHGVVGIRIALLSS